MIRISILQVALIAAPFVLFFLYRWVVSVRRAQTEGAFNDTPYQILFLLGAVATLASLVVLVLARERSELDPHDLVYVPPHVENGEIVEGRFIPREEAERRGIVSEAPDGAEDAPPADG